MYYYALWIYSVDGQARERYRFYTQSQAQSQSYFNSALLDDTRTLQLRVPVFVMYPISSLFGVFWALANIYKTKPFSGYYATILNNPTHNRDLSTMDAITDKTFTTAPLKRSIADESPSLLTIILDISAESWNNVKESFQLKTVLEALVIAINSHLAVNNSNMVGIIAGTGDGAKFLYPDVEQRKNSSKMSTNGDQKNGDVEEMHVDGGESRSISPDIDAHQNGENQSRFVNEMMYRQFKLVDETFLKNLHDTIKELLMREIKQPKNHISSALSLALAYINKTQLLNPQYKARILCINLSADEHLQYIQIMNSIFAAQKMKINIDVCQLFGNSTFLQQASDSTNGVYMTVKNQDGLVQYLTTALGIDPCLRSILIRPNVGDIDFRASCFLTGKVVDIGYVCSVCLCILSLIPGNEKCPACDSVFDPSVVMKLKRKPAVRGAKGKKKRKMSPN